MSKINRRDFIKKTAAVGAAATVLTGAQASGAAAGDKEYECIVIGGGFAGVTAAREAGRAGMRTLLLEARNRLGGRTFTSEFADHKVELGGAWVHWTQPHVWAEIMRYGLDVIETPGAAAEEFIYRENNKAMRRPADEVWDDFAQGVNTFCAEAGELFPRPFEPFLTESAWRARDHLTVAQRLSELGLSGRQHYFADSFCGGVTHNYPDVCGYIDVLRWYALAGFTAEGVMNAAARYKLKEGTKSLIDKMIEEGKPEVRLNTVVEKVSQSGGKVSVVTEGGERFTALAAIVTLPLNVLKDVEFSPALSTEKLAASGEEHGGHGTKAYIRLRGDLGNIFIAGASDEAFQSLFTYARDTEHTLLVAFGPSREAIDVIDEGAVQQWLRKYISNAEVDASFGYDWILDPFSPWYLVYVQTATGQSLLAKPAGTRRALVLRERR